MTKTLILLLSLSIFSSCAIFNSLASKESSASSSNLETPIITAECPRITVRAEIRDKTTKIIYQLLYSKSYPFENEIIDPFQTIEWDVTTFLNYNFSSRDNWEYVSTPQTTIAQERDHTRNAELRLDNTLVDKTNISRQQRISGINSYLNQNKNGFNIKGLKLGMTRIDVDYVFSIKKSTSDNDIEQLYYSRDEAPDELKTYADSNINSYRVYLKDDIVVYIELVLSNINYTLIVKSLIKKFGPPTHKEETTMQNTYGAKYQKQTLYWSNTKETLVITNMTNNINSMYVVLLNNEYSNSKKKNAEIDI